MDVRLLPVQPQDEAFLLSVYASTRAEELALTGWSPALQADFVRSQYSAQQRYYHSQFPAAQVHIVQFDGRNVGRMITEHTETSICLIDIALLPPYRNLGIGTFLLNSLLEEARRNGVPIKLHVERSNRALNWYRRLRFEVVGEHGLYVAMSWEPHAPASAAQLESHGAEDSAAVIRD